MRQRVEMLILTEDEAEREAVLDRLAPLQRQDFLDISRPSAGYL